MIEYLVYLIRQTKPQKVYLCSGIVHNGFNIDGLNCYKDFVMIRLIY